MLGAQNWALYPDAVSLELNRGEHPHPLVAGYAFANTDQYVIRLICCKDSVPKWDRSSFQGGQGLKAKQGNELRLFQM